MDYIGEKSWPWCNTVHNAFVKQSESFGNLTELCNAALILCSMTLTQTAYSKRKRLQAAKESIGPVWNKNEETCLPNRT